MPFNKEEQTAALSGRFTLLVQFKFLFSIIKGILLLCIYFTYDENIFSGLAISDERNSENYLKARSIILTGLVFFTIGLASDIFIQFLGFTANFNKINTIIVSLDIFCTMLLLFFLIDQTHYFVIWYIFLVTQVAPTLLEIYAFISTITFEFSKYNRIRDHSLKEIK